MKTKLFRIVCRENLDNALTWLYVAYGIEVKVTADAADTAQTLLNLTKAVSRKPYEIDPSPYDILAIYKPYSMQREHVNQANKKKGGISNEHFQEMWVNMLRKQTFDTMWSNQN